MQQNEFKESKRPWFVLYQAISGNKAVSPNDVVNSGSQLKTKADAEIVAKKLKAHGCTGAQAVYRPNGVDLSTEPALNVC